jgi:hypothetical protein
MRTLRLWVATAFALLFSAPVYSQDAIVGAETGFYVQSSAGVPKGCGFEFTFVYRDRTYRQGALAGITGSLTWAEFSDGTIGAALKLVGSDFDAALTRTAFSVHQGFVVADGKTLIPTRRVDCEQPTAFCGAYSLPNAVAIYKALVEGNGLVIGFSREAKGLDVTLPVDARSTAAAKPNDFQSYNACIGTLSQPGLSNLPK